MKILPRQRIDSSHARGQTSLVMVLYETTHDAGSLNVIPSYLDRSSVCEMICYSLCSPKYSDHTLNCSYINSMEAFRVTVGLCLIWVPLWLWTISVVHWLHVHLFVPSWPEHIACDSGFASVSKIRTFSLLSTLIDFPEPQLWLLSWPSTFHW